jgi:solute carrier family 25 carnitine/acylcarnitine transporter 20/29
MISAVPVQNSLLMGGYGIGKQWAELEGSSNKYAPIFVGGCTGGVVQSFLMSPVEWIKVRTQVEGQNTFKATHQLWKNHAMRRGLTATLLRDGIPHGVWFVSYEWCKTSLDEQNTALSDVHRQLSIPLASGAFAATLAWVSIPNYRTGLCFQMHHAYSVLTCCFLLAHRPSDIPLISSRHAFKHLPTITP